MYMSVHWYAWVKHARLLSCYVIVIGQAQTVIYYVTSIANNKQQVVAMIGYCHIVIGYCHR